MSKIKSGVIWQNETIVCVAIRGSKNAKTGNMLQSYIILKDVDPITGNRLGLDSAICGQCPHRGTANPDKLKGFADNRTCYVNLGQGVMQVYKAYKAGKYPILSHDQIEALGRDQVVRIGTYGDGAFVPDSVWDTLTKYSKGKTAYTHQGITQSQMYMQSVESVSQAITAWGQGKRTFRIVRDVTEVTKNETLCPVSKEAGYKTTCIDCKLCNGETKAKSIAIVVHGVGKGNFGKVQTVTSGNDTVQTEVTV